MLRAGHVGRQGRYHLFECCQLFIENFFRRLEVNVCFARFGDLVWDPGRWGGGCGVYANIDVFFFFSIMWLKV